MNITLIDPVGSTRGLNAGLGYLSAALMAAGHTVRVVDFNNYRHDNHVRLGKIKGDIVGFSLKSATVGMTDPQIKAIMENKNVRYRICGGTHISIDGMAFMKRYPFDAAFVGEAEQSIVRYAEHLEGKRSTEEIGSVIIRNGGGELARRAAGVEHIADLDALPYPAYDTFDSFTGSITDYPIVTSRGCPYSCIFCAVPDVSGRKWRVRQVDAVVDELAMAKRNYGTKKFHIIDDNFTLDMGRAKDLCQKIISSNLRLNWSCPNGVRADRLDEELLELMKRSGCESINVGIESGVDHVFAQLKKGETLAAIEQTIKTAKKVGLKVNGFFIIGIPGSSFRDDMESLQYSAKLGLDDALFNLISIYPGTELWNMVQRDKDVRMLRAWTDAFHFGGAQTVFDTPGYPSEERLKAFYAANLKRRHYLVVAGERGNPFTMALRLMGILWKYDRKNIWNHLSYLLKNIKLIKTALNL
jgi:radical SAM superfamily enzyme YgiQ (UPF0313 family)